MRRPVHHKMRLIQGNSRTSDRKVISHAIERMTFMAKLESRSLNDPYPEHESILLIERLIGLSKVDRFTPFHHCGGQTAPKVE